jgi:hypothetical protein
VVIRASSNPAALEVVKSGAADVRVVHDISASTPHDRSAKERPRLHLGGEADAVSMRTKPPRPFVDIIVDKLMEEVACGSRLAPLFADHPLLVPAPVSGMSRANTVYATRSLCRALVNGGLGERVWPCVQRLKAVPKSAFAASGQRPSAYQHWDSMSVAPALHDQGALNLLIVDDVLTRGVTLIAMATRLREAFPHALIRAFALARTDELTTSF